MKKTMTVLALAAALTSGVAAQTPAAPTAAAAPQDATAKALASLQGTWLLTSINDQDLTGQGVEMALVIEGNKYKQVTNGSVDESGTVKIDPAKKPMAFDLNILEGDDAGKLQMGIIEITGDVAKGLLGTPGAGTRPADFNSNDGAIFFVAKRVK